MIKKRYYSEMLNRCFGSREDAESAEREKIAEIVADMRQCRKYYINARHALRRAHTKKMDAYYATLRKSDLWNVKTK